MSGTPITIITYPITDTVNSKVNTFILNQELDDAGLSVPVTGVSVAGTTIRIDLSGNATAADQALCDTTVAAHEGDDFSPEAQALAKEDEVSDDSGSVIDRLVMDTGALSEGAYLLIWYMEVASTTPATTGGVRGALRIGPYGNGLTIRAEINTALNEWLPMSGILPVTVKNGSRFDIRLSYLRTGDAGDPARVQRARLSVVKPGA